MLATDFLQVTKVLHDSYVITAESQIDKVFWFFQTMGNCHSLKGCQLTVIEALQTLRQIVQLINIDEHTLETFKKGRTFFEADNPTILSGCIADLHLLQQSKRVVIFLSGNRQWDSAFPIAWSVCVADNYIHTLFTSILTINNICNPL